METRTTTFEDGPQNYDIHHEIGRGSTSVVYLATCRRGRLRNRRIALKKVIKRDSALVDDAAQVASSSTLHDSLYHPFIASLFGTFSTRSAQYYVMELCPNGTLDDLLHSRRPPVLSEAELRGVLKSLVGVLTYLHKRHIIYNGIRPSKILLSEDCRVKLCDFELAVQVESSSSTADPFCGSSDYASPEIAAHHPYSFATDLWSLGCLALTCLSGKPAFETAQSSLRCHFDLPDTVSYEARDLVNGLLQIVPGHRTPLHRILSHPFFNPSLPVSSLTASSTLAPSSSASSTLLSDPAVNRILSRPNWAVPPRMHNTKRQVTAQPGRRVFSDPTTTSRLGSVQDDTRVRSVSSYASLRQEDTIHNSNRPCSKPLAKRPETRTGCVISEVATPALTADSAFSDSDSGCSVLDDDFIPDLACEKPLDHPKAQYGSSKYTARDEPVDEFLASHPLLLRPKATSKAPLLEPHDFGKDVGSFNGCMASSKGARTRFKRYPSTCGSLDLQGARPTAEEADPAPSSSSLASLNAAYLIPKTHKLPNGSLTVLPSKALLVDFREGERRKGKKGDQVLVITADGKMVKVYDAPHLSTPCCLAEATAEYRVEDLPQSLARQYADAAKVVTKLKQRIPKLVLYEDDAHCTLMANEPLGDVEVTLLCATYLPSTNKLAPIGTTNLEAQPATIRIRLVRAHRTIEISRFPANMGGKGKRMGEWTKKIIPTLGHGYQVKVPEEEAAILDTVDREGLTRVFRFLNICEAVEMAANRTRASLTTTPEGTEASEIVEDNDSEVHGESSAGERTFRAEPSESRERPASWSSALRSGTASNQSSSTKTYPLGSIRVVPRPPKLSNNSASLGSNVADIGDSRRNWLDDSAPPWTGNC